MSSYISLPIGRQFSLAYLLAEIGLSEPEIAELEADPVSAWDWVPTVSLAETAGGKPRPAEGSFWAELGRAGNTLAIGLAVLTAVTVAVLIWWTVRS